MEVSYDDCLEVRGEIIRTVLCCIQRRGKCYKVGGANLVLRCDL